MVFHGGLRREAQSGALLMFSAGALFGTLISGGRPRRPAPYNIYELEVFL